MGGICVAQTLTVREAVDYNIENYPQAQLADLYKSFYQDAFGPGHILADTLAGRRYFEYELSDTTDWSGPIYEYTGTGRNFIRLNMDLIRKGIIPKEEYFQAFVNSLGRVEKPTDGAWIKEWVEIDSVVSSKGWNFPNETSDREMIDEKLRSGNFTVHHSRAYDSIYNFHYRIISLPQFEVLKSRYPLLK